MESLVVNPDTKIIDGILKVCKQEADVAKSFASDKGQSDEAYARLMDREDTWVLKKLCEVTKATAKVQYPYLPTKDKPMYSGCDKALKGVFNAMMESSNPRVRDFWILDCGDEKDKIEHTLTRAIDIPNLGKGKAGGFGDHHEHLVRGGGDEERLVERLAAEACTIAHLCGDFADEDVDLPLPNVSREIPGLGARNVWRW